MLRTRHRAQRRILNGVSAMPRVARCTIRAEVCSRRCLAARLAWLQRTVHPSHALCNLAADPHSPFLHPSVLAPQRNFQAAYALVLATQVTLAALLLPNTARVAAFFCSDAAAMALTVTMLPVTALNTIGAYRQPAGPSVRRCEE